MEVVVMRRSLAVLAVVVSLAAPAAAEPILAYKFTGTMAKGTMNLGSGDIDVTGAPFVASGVTTGERFCVPSWCIGTPVHATTTYDFGALGAFTTNIGGDFFEVVRTADGITGIGLRNEYPGILGYQGFRAIISPIPYDGNPFDPPSFGPAVPLSTFPKAYGHRSMHNSAGHRLSFGSDGSIYQRGVNLTSVSVENVGRTDVVLDWNRIATYALAVQTFHPPRSMTPYAEARLMSILQLAVFEAVNAVTHEYEPYLGTVVAPAGASAEAAAIAAAYNVLKSWFPGAPGAYLTTYTYALAALPDAGKNAGIATGEAAASQILALRDGDGSAPATFYAPAPSAPGVWQPTSSCPAEGGTDFQWQNVRPFGVPSVPGSTAWIEPFAPGPPPALTSRRYTKDYNEVKTVGNLFGGEDIERRSVALFYGRFSPVFIFNRVARQLSRNQGKSLSENARILALLNMAGNDSFVASFWAKYHYDFWRPETAIRGGSLDGNSNTEADVTFVPFLRATPCFPSYPSNHASGSHSAAEILRRAYGAGDHSITVSYGAALTPNYTGLKQITDDIADAGVYGGTNFRFDLEAGADLGRAIARYVYRHNLRRANGSDHSDEDANEDEHLGEREGERLP
jgi:hypothetical protein